MERMKKKIERYLNHEADGSDMLAIRSWYEADEALGEQLRADIGNCDPYIDPAVDSRMRAALRAKMIEDTPDTEARPSASETARPRRGIFHRTVDMAAAVALIAGVGVYMLSRPEPIHHNPLVVSTGNGQRSTVTLPDGTKVNVNAMSEITYRFNESTGTRDVNLKGEAYFDVARDPAHPFFVYCDNISVECKGTEFDVKGYENDDHISVVLNEGEVVISDAVTSISMRADMMVRYEKRARQFTSHRVYAEDYNGWISGDLRFTDERLDDIVKVISRNYSVRLCIVDPTLSGETFTGSLGDGSLDDRLNALTTAAGACYRMAGDSIGYIFRDNDYYK